MATGNIRAEPPLIVIVGPTASGKTALAIELARRYNGEIICADSRTVYKGMDIGTAKPTAEEQALVPHWGLDLVVPGERFTVADFKRYAETKIVEIRSRGRVPFLVGGTGLYVDAVIFDYQFGGEADEVEREKLGRLTARELQDYCIKNNIELPENHMNKRYLIRIIERQNISGTRRPTPIDNSIIVGIATDRELLRQRIEARIEQLFADNVVEEAIRLGKKYDWDNEAMTGNIYPLVRRYLENELTLKDIKEKITTLDWRLAKRQMTWLRRNPYIEWGTVPEVRQYVAEALASE